ncbi:MAG: hypothetical protein A2452_06320 [Candidatus Firestonebacteria bacterium RIFOXYC2_FULL_39_67]|nr:MAG: hypothetical protein A2452_06320 [Candidatus Firestonebacteria bacterium RIFOXYC2_FULL_39_67]
MNNKDMTSVSWIFKVGAKDILFEGIASKKQDILEKIVQALEAKGYKQKVIKDNEIRYFSTTWTKAAIVPYVENEDLRLRFIFGPTTSTNILAFFGLLFYFVGFFVVAVWWAVGMYFVRKELIFESQHQANMYKKTNKESPQVVKGDDKLDQISKLKQLMDAGAITKEEFELKKKDLLSKL